MTDKYLGGCKWEQYVLISQLAQLFYLFCLQQSEYGSLQSTQCNFGLDLISINSVLALFKVSLLEISHLFGLPIAKS